MVKKALERSWKLVQTTPITLFYCPSHYVQVCALARDRLQLALLTCSHLAKRAMEHFCVCLANLLKTAVSVLASTVRLTVSFMEPLMTVSVMLRCSQQAVSSSALDLSQSFAKFEEGEATLVPNQPSQSGRGCKER